MSNPGIYRHGSNCSESHVISTRAHVLNWRKFNCAVEDCCENHWHWSSKDLLERETKVMKRAKHSSNTASKCR